MRKLLLISGALVGFALITGSITTGSAALPGPGTIRITSLGRQGQSSQPRTSQLAARETSS